MQPVGKNEVFLVYDHACPVCHGYCSRLIPLQAQTGIHLVDARDAGPAMREITQQGLDIDQGMVLKVGETLYYGSDAIWQLTRHARLSGFAGQVSDFFFGDRKRARVWYPAGKALRNAVLRLLGIPFIHNLKPESALKHQLGAAWARLRPGIQARFARDPAAGEEFVYSGIMTVIRRSRAGWLFAQLTRLIGNPLTPYAGTDIPMQVRLYPKDGGVCWERRYMYANRKPVVVSSVKRESAEGEMLEVVGGGFGMKLRVHVIDGQLHFTSYRYFCRFLFWRLPLPHLLTPGETQVAHLDLGEGSFIFRLAIRHPLLGETFFQEGRFRRQLAKEDLSA